jgi:hypothetical protein
MIWVSFVLMLSGALLWTAVLCAVVMWFVHKYMGE